MANGPHDMLQSAVFGFKWGLFQKCGAGLKKPSAFERPGYRTRATAYGITSPRHEPKLTAITLHLGEAIARLGTGKKGWVLNGQVDSKQSGRRTKHPTWQGRSRLEQVQFNGGAE